MNEAVSDAFSLVFEGILGVLAQSNYQYFFSMFQAKGAA